MTHRITLWPSLPFTALVNEIVFSIRVRNEQGITVSGKQDFNHRNTPLGRRRYCEVESTSMTLIQRRDSVVCPVGLMSTCVVFFFLPLV